VEYPQLNFFFTFSEIVNSTQRIIRGGTGLDSLPLIIALTVLVFFVLVGIHEWGHFYFARRAGILVREFAIGFGPKLFSVRKGETTFTFRLLPIGGFVQMAGEDDEVQEIAIGQTVWLRIDDNRVTHIYTSDLNATDDFQKGEVTFVDLIDALVIRIKTESEIEQRYEVAREAVIVKSKKNVQIAPRDRHFSSKTIGQRAIAIFAGPFMNFILAFVLFMCVVLLLGKAENVKLSHVEPSMPAATAGMQVNDIVVTIDGQSIGADNRKLSEAIDGAEDREMTWVLERAGENVEVKVTPTYVEGSLRVGVIIGADRRTATIGETVTGAWDYTVFVTKLIFEGFKRLILGQFAWEDVGGPVRTVSVTVEAAKAGFPQLVYWAAILSLYLGIFNLLPIPALDGSRLIFLAIEWVRGKPVEPRKESMVHFIGFAMLMGLMIVVTFHDIARFFK
jgi:regulator of sigma E protease